MGLFTPKTVTGACVKQYVRNEDQAMFQLNAVPVKWNDGKFEVYFPRPFQIMGLCRTPLDNLPNVEEDVAKWPNVVSLPLTPSSQATYSNLTPLFMLELALANMRPLDGTPYPVEYLRAGIQGRDYRGYFTHYLNDELTMTREQFFNTFMMPPSLWKNFADLNTAASPVNWFPLFQNFISFIRKTADQRMYGAPGVYTIQDNISDWEFTIDNDYLMILES